MAHKFLGELNNRPSARINLAIILPLSLNNYSHHSYWSFVHSVIVIYFPSLFVCCLVTSQLITLHDGTAYNSAEVVWNSEPKDIGTGYTHSPTTLPNAKLYIVFTLCLR